LAAAGITDMADANRYLREHYRPAFEREFVIRPDPDPDEADPDQLSPWQNPWLGPIIARYA